MRRRRPLAGVVAVATGVLLAAAPVAGADFELTPLAGIRIGGDLTAKTSGESLDLDDGAAFGFLLGFPLDDQSIVEVELVHHETELQRGDLFNGEPLFQLDVDSIMVGGRYQYGGNKVEGFVAGGLGMTRFHPSGAGLDDEYAVVLSIGGGVLIPVGRTLAVRLEGRGIGTFILDESAVFCDESVCAIIIEGDGFVQAEFRAGLTIRF